MLGELLVVFLLNGILNDANVDLILFSGVVVLTVEHGTASFFDELVLEELELFDTEVLLDHFEEVLIVDDSIGIN
jgi:hypothetical protein